MKKFLVLVVLVLLISTSTYASTIYCKVDNAYVCTEKGCSKVKSEIFINLDTERKTYQRGDSKGIDTYDMNLYKSGNYIIADIAGSASLKIDTQQDFKFVEIVHLGLKTWNNFGMCKLDN